ncbi:hypothetical protein ACWCPG_22935, partial [Streptomyces sp. NPDC001919]
EEVLQFATAPRDLVPHPAGGQRVELLGGVGATVAGYAVGRLRPPARASSEPSAVGAAVAAEGRAGGGAGA